MARFKWYVISLLLCGLVLVFGQQNRILQLGLGSESEEEEEEEAGEFPNEWFMQQRTWPDARIEAADYQAAARQADQLRSFGRLDEQPPWMSVGPTNIGGRIADIAGSSTNAQLFYVAAASGGIFKTTNGGSSWRSIFDSAPSLSMGALAIDPAHADTLYAGTGEPCAASYSYFGTGVFKTTDGGATWGNVGLANSKYIARIVLDPSNPQIVWVAAMGELYGTNSERGLYKSTDGGASWNRSLFVNDTVGCCDVVVNPQNPSIVFAAMWERYRTPQTRQVGGPGSGIFRSTDGGTQWERLSDGLPPVGNTVGRIGLAIAASSPNIVYAVYADHPGNFMGIYRSTDGGETWARRDDGSIPDLFSNFGWYFGNIRVRPDNASVVFVLGVEMARSTNGGQNWSLIGNDVHVDHHALWFNPAQPTTMLNGNDGGLYRSTNNGNSWSFITGLPICQFYAASVDYQHPERRYGGTQDNSTMRTMTGAPDDYEIIWGGDGFYTLVDPTNSNIIFAEYQYGGLGRSTDNGITWMDATNGINPNDRINWSMPVVMSPDDPQTMYCGTQRVYRSLNQGDSWQSISPDLTGTSGPGNLVFPTITTIAVSAVDPTVIYAGTDNARVWVTRNGGTTWTERSAGLPQRWITRLAPDAIDVGVVYVTCSGFRNAEQDAHLFRSTNYGETWQSISGGLPAGPLNHVIPDPSNPGRLFVASDFGTYVTPDLGAHWIALGFDMPRVPVIDLVLHQPTRQLMAATYGRSLYTLDLNAMTINNAPTIVSFNPPQLDTVYTPQSVLFSVTAQDADSDSLSYRWFLNDTLAGSGMQHEFYFAESGRFMTVVADVADREYHTTHSWTFYVENAAAISGGDPVPEKALLIQAYPNPFNATTTLEYNLPRAGTADIIVFDIMGRRVATLLQGFQPAGRGRITWLANAYPSGTYLIQISSAHQTQLEKALIIR